MGHEWQRVELFISYGCRSFPQCDGQDCKFKCNSANESFDCFLLDNNGFILAVANNSETVSITIFGYKI